MKKSQKNFVVEYKGARRKRTTQSNSIWGNVDLSQFAEHDGQTQAPLTGGLSVVSDAAMHEVPGAPALATAMQQDTTLALEEQMADETSVTEQASTESETALPKAPEPKKRGPRAKKTAPKAVASDALVETPAVKKTQAKRGSKNTLAEVKPSTRRGGRKAKATVEPPVESAPQAVSPITAAGDEMADLLQLEQENQRLRKLLAEKLRAENADLRKRLGLD